MIQLTHGSTRATINPDGAWVETLISGDAPVFFSKAALTHESGQDKLRGGMHICLPNFGPGGESGLAQHGFGRASTWVVDECSESKTVLRLKPDEPGYAGLDAVLTYTLESSALHARLELGNRGDRPLRVAPAFHPYFALDPSEKTVVVNDEPYELASLAGTEYRTADTATLHTANRHIRLTQENLSTWAIWTDQLGSYVCVEPTFGGNRFLEPEQPDESLLPGRTKEYSFVIRW